MRDYGQVQCSFWQSDDAQSFSDVGKLLALYLITGPHSNGLGCYWLPDGYLMADLRWDAETISKGFAELSRKGFANRFESVVFIPKYLRWNGMSNPNVATNRQREWEALPRGEAKTLAARALLEFGRHLNDDFRTVLETVTQTVSQTLSKQDPRGEDPNREDPDPDPNRTEPTAPTTARGTPSALESAAPIGEDWKPNTELMRWLSESGLTESQQLEVIAEFIRFARSAGWRKTPKNWQLAFGRNPKVKAAIGSAASKRSGPKRDPDKARRNVLELAKLMRIDQGEDDWSTFEKRVLRANERRIANLGEQPRKKAGAGA